MAGGQPRQRLSDRSARLRQTGCNCPLDSGRQVWAVRYGSAVSARQMLPGWFCPATSDRLTCRPDSVRLVFAHPSGQAVPYTLPLEKVAALHILQGRDKPHRQRAIAQTCIQESGVRPSPIARLARISMATAPVDEKAASAPKPRNERGAGAPVPHGPSAPGRTIGPSAGAGGKELSRPKSVASPPSLTKRTASRYSPFRLCPVLPERSGLHGPQRAAALDGSNQSICARRKTRTATRIHASQSPRHPG